MPAPGEHKTVQARILAYAEAIGWIPLGGIPREEAERRRGLRKRGLCFAISASHPSSPRHQPTKGDRKVPSPLSLFFDDLLDAKVREFNPLCSEAKGALLGEFRHLHADIYGNREYVGLMEKAGRGSVMVIQQCNKQGLPAPKWTSDEKLGVTLTFFAPEVTPEVTTDVTPEVRRLIENLEKEMLRRELQARMSLKDDEHFRKAYLLPALRAGLVEMTDPSKPRSSKQRYRLTPAGKRIRAQRLE